MKRFAGIVLCLFALGCASVKIPNYIRAEHPYERTVYGSYDEVLAAVKDVLKEQGWTVIKETHPALYERNAVYTEEDKEHALIFTNIRQSSRFVYSRFSHMNVYIHRVAEGVKLDVRYGSVTDIYVKKMYRYRNDSLTKRFLDLVEQKLNAKK
jgi:hypothetical protein